MQYTGKFFVALGILGALLLTSCIIYTVLQNLTIKLLVFPEICTNFAPKESFQRKI